MPGLNEADRMRQRRIVVEKLLAKREELRRASELELERDGRSDLVDVRQLSALSRVGEQLSLWTW